MNRPLRHLSFGIWSLVGICSLGLGASAPAQPDPNWLDHDRDRPSPPVVRPAVPSTDEKVGKSPSDAIVLFDGKDNSQWVSLDGSPTRWIVRDGYKESERDRCY